MKVNILGWRLLMNRLPTRANLIDRSVDIPSALCFLCWKQSHESGVAIMFHVSILDSINSRFIREDLQEDVTIPLSKLNVSEDVDGAEFERHAAGGSNMHYSDLLIRLKTEQEHLFRYYDFTSCGWSSLARHLNGTVLESFVRPVVLITDAYNALSNQPSRRQRDQEFLGLEEQRLDSECRKEIAEIVAQISLKPFTFELAIHWTKQHLLTHTPAPSTGALTLALFHGRTSQYLFISLRNPLNPNYWARVCSKTYARALPTLNTDLED
ncbi:hypothetical protein L1987_42366 [Smallanthus sonchifolius]|uniref:Uncharacterized protein n=1 Tax=Smallanthus sonchifolius TaxID=185202 RepID=A0ACB9GIN4_9ASTR|nr:hypothetical protein L1987_42366 [Smallanthus sonchifolius]